MGHPVTPVADPAGWVTLGDRCWDLRWYWWLTGDPDHTRQPDNPDDDGGPVRCDDPWSVLHYTRLLHRRAVRQHTAPGPLIDRRRLGHYIDRLTETLPHLETAAAGYDPSAPQTRSQLTPEQRETRRARDREAARRRRAAMTPEQLEARRAARRERDRARYQAGKHRRTPEQAAKHRDRERERQRRKRAAMTPQQAAEHRARQNELQRARRARAKANTR